MHFLHHKQFLFLQSQYQLNRVVIYPHQDVALVDIIFAATKPFKFSDGLYEFSTSSPILVRVFNIVSISALYQDVVLAKIK